MTVRGKLRARIAELRKIGEKAKEDNNQAVMADVMIRIAELNYLIKNL